jgi:Tol biopolymer transport system component
LAADLFLIWPQIEMQWAIDTTWSAHDRPSGVLEFTRVKAIELFFVGSLVVGWAYCAPADPVKENAPMTPADASSRLADEVRNKGWIVFAARSKQSDWDLFVCRPDGSSVHNLSRTPEFNEAAPQFSHDGCKLLYRRLPRNEAIDGNRYGEQGELVIANSDGTEAQVFGKPGEYPWASWSPDGKEIACLSIKGISLVNVASRQVLCTLQRKGFFQQLTWSPDGRWFCGVANSYGTGWSIARMEAASGVASAVNRIDCCTPDWFPDSKSLIFSWRTPGQKGNRGQGWTQLWRVDAEGKWPQLVYGEDGRHVYGGHVSPDARYVLFTGNMREDGDPGNAGAPMGLMRLSDAPVIGGQSPELRALHPKARSGPVLRLPVGWEPCWTFAEISPPPSAAAMASTEQASTGNPPPLSAPNEVLALSAELHDNGWIVFSAAIDSSDWDLFLMRPDGSARHRITNTREFNEAGARFSPDGKRLLYYRLPRAEPVDNNTYGTFDLVLADSDGRNPVVYGGKFHWASWGPDGTQLACLSTKAIEIIDVGTRKVIRQLPRKGIVQQLIWSPDGKRFVGTANGLGPFWNIGCLNAETGALKAISETERYNCTPDWCADSQHVVYARGIIPNAPGRAELWVANAGGTEKHALYLEEGRHIYGACPSPDGKYALFTRSVEDLGRVDHTGTTMAIIRWEDTPIIGDESEALHKRFPNARHGPRLDLGQGWEPHWTYAELKVPEK